MFFLFLCGSRVAGGEMRDAMAKFLMYENRLEIQNGLKEHMTFTQIRKKLGEQDDHYQGSEESFYEVGHWLQFLST